MEKLRAPCIVKSRAVSELTFHRSLSSLIFYIGSMMTDDYSVSHYHKDHITYHLYTIKRNIQQCELLLYE